MDNLRAIDLNLLVVLDALLAERNVTRGANALGMTQPAVSHTLVRLRDLLGDQLFVRHSGGLHPTARLASSGSPDTILVDSVAS